MFDSVLEKYQAKMIFIMLNIEKERTHLAEEKTKKSRKGRTNNNA